MSSSRADSNQLVLVPLDYFSCSQRSNLLLMLGNVQGGSQTADGIAFQIFHTFKRACLAKKPVTLHILQTTLPESFLQWAIDAGVVWANTEGDYGCIYQDLIQKKRSVAYVSRTVPVEDRVTDDELESVYSLYPKRGNAPMGKGKGMEKLKLLPKTDLPALTTAALNVKTMRERMIIRSDEFVPMFSTFANNWRDYLPENTGDADHSGFNVF